MDEQAKRIPPYLPFKTFLSSLDALAHGVPPKVDRMLWRSQSGVTQGLIMNAYRFLGLVDEDDSANEWLERIVNPNQRGKEMKTLLEYQYENILSKHDLTKMTLKMLEDEFEKNFAVTGGTKQKAITFFLKAAKFADMPLSPYLTAQLRTTRKKRSASKGRTAPLAAGEVNGSTIIPVIPNTQGAETHSIRLVSGGTVTISISFNPFTMPSEDRTFVFSLIDKIQEYENAHPLEASDDEDEGDE